MNAFNKKVAEMNISYSNAMKSMTLLKLEIKKQETLQELEKHQG